MTPQQFEHVQQLFLRIQGKSAESRERELAAESDETRLEVESLLAAYDGMGTFLEHRLQDSLTPLLPTPSSRRAPVDVELPRRVGPYRLLQQIGEGGHGTVFMAKQKGEIERTVAIKLIKPGMDSKQILARFYAERQTLAMMDHPSISRVLDAGTTETGAPYFVMELVAGIPIHDFCEQNRLTLHERLRLFLQVCNAVHHAHRKGVIHRDLKPSNVLVSMGESEPIAKVIDFGIAKALDTRLTQQTLFTEYGQMIGTLEYMSPEQAEMSSGDIDTRSDVYSMGVLLYQLLTGETPISKDQLLSKGLIEIASQIRDTEAPAPSSRITKRHRREIREHRSRDRLNGIDNEVDRGHDRKGVCSLPSGDLDWITMKALAKDRRRRYDSALDFARDISRFLKGEPVHAHPPSIFYSFHKLIRRHGLAVAVGLLIMTSGMVGIVGLSTGRNRAEIALAQAKIDRDAAREAQAFANQSSRQLAEKMYSEMVESAWRAAEMHDMGRAQELLDTCLTEMRGWEWRFVDAHRQRDSHIELRPVGQSAVTSIALAGKTSGKAVAACVLENGAIEIRRGDGDQLLHTIQGDFLANVARFSRDGTTLIVGASSGELLVFDTTDWQVVKSEKLTLGGIYDVCLSNETATIVVCTGGGYVLALDCQSLEVKQRWKLPARVTSIELIESGKQAGIPQTGSQQIVAAGLDGEAYLLELGDKAITSSFVSESSLNQIAKLREKEYVFLSAGMAIQIDVDSFFSPPKKLLRSQGLMSALAITQSGMVAVGCGDGSIIMQNASGEQRDAAKFDAAVTTLVADNDRLIVALSSGRLLQLDLDRLNGWLPIGETQSSVSVTLPSRGIVITLDDLGWMRSFDISTGKLLSKQEAHTSAAWAASCDRNETLLVTVGEDQRLRCWELPALKLRFERAIDWGVRDVCVAPDATWIAAAPPKTDELGVREGTIAIWDAATGGCRKLLAGHENWVLKLTASTDSERLISSGENRTTRIWDLGSGELSSTIAPKGKSPVVLHALDHDANSIFLAHRDGWITSWNLSDGTAVASWSAFGDAITGLVVTPDNRILATSRSSELLRVYDINRAKTVAEFDLGFGYVDRFDMSGNQAWMSLASGNRQTLISRTAADGSESQ